MARMNVRLRGDLNPIEPPACVDPAQLDRSSLLSCVYTSIDWHRLTLVSGLCCAGSVPDDLGVGATVGGVPPTRDQLLLELATKAKEVEAQIKGLSDRDASIARLVVRLDIEPQDTGISSGGIAPPFDPSDRPWE
jgi:hypothetical protein